MVSPISASRIAETAPAAPAARPAQLAVDVTAITTQDDFLLELGEALSGQAAVHPVDTLEAALETLSSSKRTQVLVIDAGTIADVPAAITRAQAAHPQLPVLVFADAALHESLAAARKDKQFMLLATPIDPAKARGVLERALAAATRPAATAAPAPESEPVRSRAATSGPRALPVIAGALVLAALAAAGGVFWYLHKPAAAPAVHAAAPVKAAVADTSIVQGKVDELLEKARLAMHERRFTEPNGDNALLYYRSAAAADSSNAEARDGLQRVANALAGRFGEALSGARFEEAALTLANFRLAAPGDARSGGFEQQLYAAEIGKALADGNLDRAAAYLRQAQSASVPAEQIGKWRTEIARHQEDARIQHLAGLVSDRIRDGRLADGDDSAQAYVQQLQASAASSSVTDHATHDLIAAELRRAREAALAKNSADEEHWLTQARALGLKPAELAAFQKELSGARQKAAQIESEHLLQLARQRVQEGRLTDPPQDSAAYYLTQLQSSDAGNAALTDAAHALAKALLERARGAMLAGKSADADLTLARQWGADAGDIQAVQQLQAPKSAPSVDPASLAANLKRTRTTVPDYPPNALLQHLTGSVTLQFTVDVRGATRDIHVVEATSPGIFDQSAIDAVKHWRYQPMLVDGSAIEVPVTTRLRFELPK